MDIQTILFYQNASRDKAHVRFVPVKPNKQKYPTLLRQILVFVFKIFIKMKILLHIKERASLWWILNCLNKLQQSIFQFDSVTYLRFGKHIWVQQFYRLHSQYFDSMQQTDELMTSRYCKYFRFKTAKTSRLAVISHISASTHHKIVANFDYQ